MKSLTFAWPGMLASNSFADSCDLQRELHMAPPGLYGHVPSPAVFSASDGYDWLREVLQNLSGIQRKSKGRGQFSQCIFHQSSEFIAVYAGRPKSSVHLLVAPKRLVQCHQVTVADAPMVGRLAIYAAHLARCLSWSQPGKRFAAGFRVRRGLIQHFHGHLLSMDIAPPRFDGLDRRNFEDFTSGPSHFTPLDELACRLAVGDGLPQDLHSNSRKLSKELACHRCGQRFGDAMLELARHLAQCQVWPECVHGFDTSNCSSKKAKGIHEADGDAEIDVLEAMGFVHCGRAVLRAALLAAGGSVERAVAQLVA
jgi:diadenosine tetraphosphate (Ap4A) HIT family hydrolase